MSLHPTLISSEASWQDFREKLSPETKSALAAKADRWLDAKPFSVVDKAQPAPSGDPHDYVSMGPYWWPDPAKPDGLPWIRRDGQVNPETQNYDKPKMEAMSAAVTLLVLQSYASDSVAHGRAAGRLLKAWFLDEKTRMNPHLRHGQFIPGICDGRGIGIIDTTSLVFLLDAVIQLDFNADWTETDLAALKQWFAHYLDWMLTSQLGRDEAREHNNHGTWYDAQVACFAIFCGKPELAHKHIETSVRQRITSQIAPDGSQPHELSRTLSFSYCTYNLLAFACLARISASFDLDLWRWKNPAGASILSAVEWMSPYYSGEKPWTHEQLKAPDMTSVVYLLIQAGEGSGEPHLSALADRLAKAPSEKISMCKADLIPKGS